MHLQYYNFFVQQFTPTISEQARSYKNWLPYIPDFSGVSVFYIPWYCLANHIHGHLPSFPVSTPSFFFLHIHFFCVEKRKEKGSGDWEQLRLWVLLIQEELYNCTMWPGVLLLEIFMNACLAQFSLSDAINNY